MRQGAVFFFRFGVNEKGVALVKGAALGILAGQANGIAFEQYRTHGESFRETVIDGAFAVSHFGALLEELDDFGMHVEALGYANKRVRDFREFCGVEAGVRLVFGLETAPVVGRPVFRQLPQVRNFFDFAGFALFLFVFLTNAFDDLHRLNADALGINAPERRMILDAVVEARLGHGGVVDFAMAVAAVADEIDHDIAAKLRAIFGRELSDAHDGVRIFAIHVKDGNGLALGEVGSEAGGMLLLGPRGEADQVVHDDVNRAADGIGLKVSEIERFRPDALAGKGGVAVHDDGDNVLGAAGAVARLLGAGAADSDGIDGFEVAGVGDEVDADFFAGGGDVGAGGADVIFHVTCA